MFKKILHPTDFSEVALQAFDQAVALALRYGAELQVVHAVVLYEYDKMSIKKGLGKLNDAYDSLRRELKIHMEEMVEDSDIANSKCTLVIKRGFGAGEVILERAEKSGVDLIVMGTHGHSPIRRFFLGSVAEKVVRYAPCPVMVLGRQEDAPGRFENILLPVDFSKASHGAADVAAELARTHEASLHLLHVYQDLVPPAYYIHTEDAFVWDPGLKKRGEEALEEFMARHGSKDVEMVPHLAEGRVSRAIVDLSNELTVDLIVMGTAGLTGLHHLMLGSVTEKVLRKADVPVLTVRARPGDKQDE